jgi:uncharacterized protein (TIGR02594 family)
VSVVRRELTKAEADELMANIRMEDPQAELELVPQANGLFTVVIRSSADTVASRPVRDASAPSVPREEARSSPPLAQPGAELPEEPAWLQIARGQLGTKEVSGPASNPVIESYFACTTGGPRPDDVAWCGAFVSFCLAKAHVITKGSARAADWLSWGTQLDAPKLGCVVVLKPQAAGASGHVGFWVGEEAGNLALLGGNQGNEVKVSRYAVSEVRSGGYRWPS